MVSIVSLVLLMGAVTAGAGWVAAGGERIAYAGVQIAFAFYMCIFQGYKPGTDFDTIRDRLVGIVLGLVVSTVVFHYIWPEHAVDRLRAALARALRNLARLLVIPGIGATIETERQAAAQLRSEITKTWTARCTCRNWRWLRMVKCLLPTAVHLPHWKAWPITLKPSLWLPPSFRQKLSSRNGGGSSNQPRKRMRLCAAARPNNSAALPTRWQTVSVPNQMTLNPRLRQGFLPF